MVARKLDGYAMLSGSLTVFDRPGVAEPFRGYVRVSGARHPKVSGTAEVFDVATNRRVCAGKLESTGSMTDKGASYNFVAPCAGLSPDKEYVIVAASVVSALATGKIDTEPLHVRIVQ